MLHPIFLDDCPDYLRSADGTGSLLLAPVGTTRLFPLLQAAYATAGLSPAVVTMCAQGAGYREALAECGGPVDVVPMGEFHGDHYGASDWLLFIDARLYCVDGARRSAMLRDSVRPRASATHLVAMARHAGGTNERVEFSPDGRVRRIQRYFDSATWPLLTGVACSLVSAACLRTSNDRAAFDSLLGLRQLLSARAVPARDVPIAGEVYDLTREDEFLRLTHDVLLAPGAVAHTAPDAQVHATARLVGPVVIRTGAVVGAGARIVGPAVIGEGAHVGEDAVVTHSVIMERVTVTALSSVNHRVIAAGDALNEAAGVPLPPADEDEGAESEMDLEETGGTVYPAAKMLVDMTLSGLALIVLAPLLAVIAVLIKIDSQGPVLYVDRREGLNGTVFPCLKFRTMRVGADLRQRELQAKNDVDGPQFKLEKDPRLTRLGRWLRPMSLDELPQLVNIVLGHMSLVGPRPSPFRENQTCVPWREARLSVRPGITGLWQVCRHDRPEGDFHQWIYFDLLYVQHMSLWLDLKIVIATVLTRGGQHSVPVQRLIAGPRLQA